MVKFNILLVLTVFFLATTAYCQDTANDLEGTYNSTLTDVEESGAEIENNEETGFKLGFKTIIVMAALSIMCLMLVVTIKMERSQPS